MDVGAGLGSVGPGTVRARVVLALLTGVELRPCEPTWSSRALQLSSRGCSLGRRKLGLGERPPWWGP